SSAGRIVPNPTSAAPSYPRAYLRTGPKEYQRSEIVSCSGGDTQRENARAKLQWCEEKRLDLIWRDIVGAGDAAHENTRGKRRACVQYSWHFTQCTSSRRCPAFPCSSRGTASTDAADHLVLFAMSSSTGFHFACSAGTNAMASAGDIARV